MRTVVKVHGVPDTLAAFADLPRTLQNRHMRIAINAAGGVIRDAAAANVPRETGLLRKSLKVKARVPNASHDVRHWGKPAYAVVGPARKVVGLATTVRGVTRGGIKRAIKAQSGIGAVRIRRASRYAHLVERGTKPHRITAKNARVLSDGAGVFGETVNHPGSKGRAFLSQAVSGYGQVALGKMQRKLLEGVRSWVGKRQAQITRQLVEA